MEKLAILVFLLLFPSVLMVDPPKTHLHMNNTHVNCFSSYRIRLGSENRPRPGNILPIGVHDSDPHSSGAIPLARHHIIPYHVLRDFYNNLTLNEQHFQHFFDNILVVAGFNAGVDLRTIENLNFLRSSRLDELPVVFHNYIERNEIYNRQVNVARQLYTWMTFNIFIGPTPSYRSNDPEERFEDDAHIIVGGLRLTQLRRIQEEMMAYNEGRNTNPIHLLNEIGDLLRLNPEPYPFLNHQWRYNINSRTYAIAINDILADDEYMILDDAAFCAVEEYAFVRYNPPDFGRRSRRLAQKKKPCLLRDEGAVYDRYCINSLNVLSELIKENIVTLNDNEITLNSASEPEGTKPKIPHSACNPPLAAAGGAVTGGLSAFAACLLAGGAYIPFVGWAGCAAGGIIYGSAGAVIGSSISLAQCE